MSPAELLSTVLFTLYTTVPSESVCSVPQPVGVRCALGLDNTAGLTDSPRSTPPKITARRQRPAPQPRAAAPLSTRARPP